LGNTAIQIHIYPLYGNFVDKKPQPKVQITSFPESIRQHALCFTPVVAIKIESLKTIEETERPISLTCTSVTYGILSFHLLFNWKEYIVSMPPMPAIYSKSLISPIRCPFQAGALQYALEFFPL
jgi:hypothetical protein